MDHLASTFTNHLLSSGRTESALKIISLSSIRLMMPQVHMVSNHRQKEDRYIPFGGVGWGGI